jgi:hypothetical protein
MMAAGAAAGLVKFAAQLGYFRPAFSGTKSFIAGAPSNLQRKVYFWPPVRAGTEGAPCVSYSGL